MKSHFFKFCIYRWVFISCLWLGVGLSSAYAQSREKNQRSVDAAGSQLIRNQTDSEHTVKKIHDSLQIRPGYAVQVVASEPLIADPVTARLDHKGRLWVVEMPDYPMGPGEG